MGHRFHIYDVFTKKKLAGNQLAIVEDADDLSPSAMQAIAREFGFSETVFLQSSALSVAAARVRIFTPFEELPFAGHPTIGSAIFLATCGPQMNDNGDQMLLMLDQSIGLVRAAVSLGATGAAFAEFDVPELPEVRPSVPEADLVADALGVGVEDVGFENHKILSAELGIKYIFVPLRSSNVVRRACVEPSYWEAAFGPHAPLGVFIYARDEAPARGFHVRMFAPDMGITEDAATGSAAAAFARVVQQFEVVKRRYYETLLRQGVEMGRPSEIKLEVEFDEAGLSKVRVGGHAVRVASGELL